MISKRDQIVISGERKHSGATGRVLIADHDDVMLIGVAELLRRRGIDVETTNNLSGEASSGDYDVVIFDPLIEPEGLDAARRFVMCMDERFPSPSLIVVSEFLDDVEEIGAESGPDAVLHAKPVRIAVLAQSVEGMLSRRRLPGKVNNEAEERA